MTGGSEDELWEGENLVYRCKNDTLVLNDDPDMVKVQCNNNIRMIVTHLYSTSHITFVLVHRMGHVTCYFDIHVLHKVSLHLVYNAGHPLPEVTNILYLLALEILTLVLIG